MSVKASSTTITVQDADGKQHIIHSDEFGIAALLDVMAKAGPDAEDAARYRWLRDQCDYKRRIVIAEYSEKPYLLDHNIDKGMCGL